MDLNMTLFPKHTKGDRPAFKNVEDFRSLIWATHFVIPKETILESEYTFEQIDKMFSNFNLLITFNKFKDTIKIENLDILVTEDSIDYLRNDIDNMRKNIAPQNYFTTYTSEEESLDTFIKK